MRADEGVAKDGMSDNVNGNGEAHILHDVIN